MRLLKGIALTMAIVIMSVIILVIIAAGTVAHHFAK